MTREELESHILDTYNATYDCPWPRYPSNQVFRHPGNQKWFALLMDVPASVFASRQPRNKSAGTDDKKVCVLNLKCDPILAGSFRSDPGIHPAYHMNKDKWISIELAIVPEETTLLLLEMSFNATAPKNAISKKQTPKPKKPYPEQFFSDLGIKELLPDADLAESLISFLIAETISPTYKDDYKLLAEYYKEQKTLDEIAHERGVTRECIRQKRIRGLRRIRSRYYYAYQAKTLDEYYNGAEKRSAENQAQWGNIITPGQPLTLDSAIQELDITSVRVYNGLWKGGVHTVRQFLALTGKEKFKNIGAKSWEEIKQLQDEVRNAVNKTGR